MLYICDISMQLHACIALRSCHAVHMRTDCDMMCKPPAYNTMYTYTDLIVCNETDQTNTRGSNNEATSHTINK